MSAELLCPYPPGKNLTPGTGVLMSNPFLTIISAAHALCHMCHWEQLQAPYCNDIGCGNVGVPVAFPGEALTAEAMKVLAEVQICGGKVTGASDSSLKELLVLNI